MLFTRDLKAQYRKSFLGYFWAFAPPMISAFVFIFLRSSGAVQINDPGVPYPLFVITGTLMWQSLVDAINNANTGMQKSRNLLARINFPREAILLSSIWLLLFNTSIRVLIMAGLLAYYGVWPGMGILQFLFSFAGLLTLGLGMGIFLSLLGSLYTDVTRALPLVMQFMMYLSPVIYPPKMSGTIGFLSTYNPFSPFLISARQALINQEQTHLQGVLTIFPIAVIILLMGWLSFKTVMPRLIERMAAS